MNKKTKNLRGVQNKKLAITAGALLGATFSTLGVMAATEEVYNKDGLIMQLTNGKNGEMKLTVQNNTEKDMHDVTLNNKEIKGLTVSDKEILIGEVKAGETKEVDFKYSLEKATVEIIDKSVSESGQKNDDKKSDNQKVETSDESNLDNGLLKIAIPVTIMGVTGLLVIYAVKKNKKTAKNSLALLVSVGALGASIVAGSASLEALDSINPETGRITESVLIQGVTTIEGEEYEYAGTFYFENDHIQETLEEEAIPVGVVLEEDSEMPVGSFKVVESNVKEGSQKVKVTHVNGKEVKREAMADAIPAVDYKVIVGTKVIAEKEAIPFETIYEANKKEMLGYKEVAKEGADGTLTITSKMADDTSEFKNKVLTGELTEGADKSLVNVIKEVTVEPVQEVVSVGTRSQGEETIKREVVYHQDTTKEIVGDSDNPDNFETTEEGADGLYTVYFVQEVDTKTGEVIGEKSEDSREVTKPQITKHVNVAAKEVSEEVIPFEEEIRELEDEWASYYNIVIEGKDGSEIVTYVYEINPETGARGKKTEVDSDVVVEPVTQVIEKGTKLYEAKIETKEEVIPFITESKLYVNDISALSNEDALNKLSSEFDSKANERGVIVNKEGKNGLATFDRTVQVQEDGSYYTPISPTEWVEDKTKRVDEINQIETFKNFNVKDVAIPHETKYVANTDDLVGSVVTAKEGVNGVERVATIYSDKALSDTLDSIVYSRTKPTTEIVSVGAKEVETVVIPFEEEIIYDDTLWDNYREVEVTGKDGSKEVVYNYNVDSSTGQLSNRTYVKENITLKPITQKVRVGTKKPEYKEVEKTSVVKPADTITNGYISEKDFADLKTVSELQALRDEFDKEWNSKSVDSQLTPDMFVSVTPKNGKTGGIYKVAVDPETGEEITSYGNELVTEINVAPVQGVNVKFNAKLGKTREVMAKVVYKADPTLEFGEKVTEQVAVNGAEQLATLDGGSTNWLAVGDIKPQDGLVRVGNVEKIEQVSPSKEVVELDNFMFTDENPDKVPGKDGLSVFEYTYNVNPETGELTDKTQTGETVIREAEDTVVWKGAIVRHGEKASEEAMNAFIEELNRLRADAEANGKGYALNPVTRAYDSQAHIDYATQMILSRDSNGFGFKHVHMDDEVLTTSSGETPTNAGIMAARKFFASPAHKGILTGDEVTRVTVSAYRVGNYYVFVANTYL